MTIASAANLQVIGEAILSLPPEECDRVFPQLYLPVMEEANRRVLLPHRKYLPTPDWFRCMAGGTSAGTGRRGGLRGLWSVAAGGKAAGRPDRLRQGFAAAARSSERAGSAACLARPASQTNGKYAHVSGGAAGSAATSRR
jgi:hypothetical protein